MLFININQVYPIGNKSLQGNHRRMLCSASKPHMEINRPIQGDFLQPLRVQCYPMYKTGKRIYCAYDFIGLTLFLFANALYSWIAHQSGHSSKYAAANLNLNPIWSKELTDRHVVNTRFSVSPLEWEDKLQRAKELMVVWHCYTLRNLRISREWVFTILLTDGNRVHATSVHQI